MKIIEKKVYHCEFCKKYSLFKHVITQHEKLCKFNPENKHKCFEYCNFLKKDGGFDCLGELTEVRFYCTKKQIHLKSYKVKRNSYLMERNMNYEWMPKECELFETYKKLPK